MAGKNFLLKMACKKIPVHQCTIHTVHLDHLYPIKSTIFEINFRCTEWMYGLEKIVCTLVDIFFSILMMIKVLQALSS